MKVQLSEFESAFVKTRRRIATIARFRLDLRGSRRAERP